MLDEGLAVPENVLQEIRDTADLAITQNRNGRVLADAWTLRAMVESIDASKEKTQKNSPSQEELQEELETAIEEVKYYLESEGLENLRASVKTLLAAIEPLKVDMT